MEAAPIPSTSAFLRSPVRPPAPAAAAAAASTALVSTSPTAKRKPAVAKPRQVKATPDGVAKPKQSKSRNGIFCHVAESSGILGGLAVDLRYRVRDVQGEAIEVR
jgi:hypothetical protein